MRLKQSAGIVASLLGFVMILTGCGTYAATPQSSWLSVNSAQNSVTLTVDESYNQANNGRNIDGYANGQMVVTIPQGYQVKVHVTNMGGIPSEFGVYNANDHLAFVGAGDSLNSIESNPGAGIVPGQSETFKFVASTPGTYRMDNLLMSIPGKGQQDFGMWAVFKVVPSGAPGVTVS